MHELAFALRPLFSLSAKVFPPARRLYRERSASLVPVAGEASPPKLDGFFDSTLSRLSDGHIDAAWWRNLLHRAGHLYVAPEILQREDLQTWLKDDQARADFKALTSARMTDAPEGPEIRSRLRERYTAITGEPEYLADDPVEAVVAILLAAFVAELGPTAPLALLTLESDRQTRTEMKRGLDDVTRALERLGPDRLTEEAHSDRATKELARLRQRAAWDPAQAREQVRQLLERVLNGDLRHADRTARGAVLHWAARLHAGQTEHLEEAKDFRSQLLQFDPAADTRILDALISMSEGDGDKALRILRDVDEPDARGIFLWILYRVKGTAAALEWFDEQQQKGDPSFLTGSGWRRLAVSLAESGHWDEAADYLAQAQVHQDDCVDLAFVEGVVHAAMLVPAEWRSHAFEMNFFHPEISTAEGPEADRHRECATLSFKRAEERMAEPFPERAQGARYWLLWLRLTHPDPAVSQAAREEVREQLQNSEKALFVVDVARAFGIPFDMESLRRILDQRKRQGGLEEGEIQADFMLAQMSLPPKDLLEFLDREEAGLRRILPPGLLSVARIEALANDGQVGKAREVLAESAEQFIESDRQRLAAMLDEHEGKDPLPRLLELYQDGNGLIDLQNLVRHLERVKDWSALRPHLEELFRRERTLRNALRLVACLESDRASGEAHILSFLEANLDLVEKNRELRSAKAWTLFRAGRLDEARTEIRRLRSERSSPSDLQLEINLALQSGAWESFATILEEEWDGRTNLDPEMLIQLASLAAEANTTSSRAFELLKLAAEKGGDDPHLLTKAIGLAYRLGREGEELRGWLSRAIALSSGEGPIQTFDLRTLIEEWMPADRERRRMADEQLLHGSIPLHMAASALHVPLSFLLIDLPRGNTLLQDGRRRTIIPIVSGARQPVPIRPEWTVGLDITSLLVLQYLGLLRTAIDSFPKVVLSPETMVLLLNERNRVRFHQPSILEKAEEILGLIGSRRLKSEESLPSPPQWLIEEVGLDLAQLLQVAKENQGLVVRPLPIYKAGSLMDQIAGVGEYEALVWSTVDFERALHGKGILDATTHQRAAPFLQSQDLNGRDTAVLLLEGPLYLDDLAVRYLQNAGILKLSANAGLDLRIHPSMFEDQSSLIEQSRRGEELERSIEELRVALRDSMQAGRLRFLPRHEPKDDEELLTEIAPALGQFLQDSRPCDAVCIDDRYFNHKSFLSDRQGRTIPVLCIFDVLDHLAARGLLTDEGKQGVLHRLRHAGFAFVPVEPKDLKSLLTLTQSNSGDTFFESAELRIIRQTLARIRSLDMLRQPGERALPANLRLVGWWVISQLWLDENLPLEKAFDLTKWVWQHLVSPPLEWEEEDRGAALAAYQGLLFRPLPILQDERRAAFVAWLEEVSLVPLAPANAKVLDQLATWAGLQIEHWSDTIANDTEGPDR